MPSAKAAPARKASLSGAMSCRRLSAAVDLGLDLLYTYVAVSKVSMVTDGIFIRKMHNFFPCVKMYSPPPSTPRLVANRRRARGQPGAVCGQMLPQLLAKSSRMQCSLRRLAVAAGAWFVGVYTKGTAV